MGIQKNLKIRGSALGVGLIFGPGIFLGFVGNPRVFFGFDLWPHSVIPITLNLEYIFSPPPPQVPGAITWIVPFLGRVKLLITVNA